MVKVHEEGTFRVYVYSPPREHQPPHVHVECARGGEVLIRLGDHDAPASLWQNHHMSMADAREAVRIVQMHQQRFLDEWSRLHG
ncbi:MAG: DUF4160 domain-containing protein [Gemmatimonadaceae bacterium]|nr:DUF4160 domain-containing protein [Gemmatimonadaceae bacterium]